MRLLVVVLVGCGATPEPTDGDPCDTPGVLCTIAGDDGIGLGQDDVPATSSSLYFPQDVGFDDDGNLVIVDFNNHRIRRVIDGIVGSLVGHQGVPGDGPEGDIGEASVNHPTGIAFHDGGMWIAGFHNARLYRVDLATNELVFEAGNAQRGYAGDGGTVVDAVVNQPTSLVFDDDGAILFSDQGNQLVRRIGVDGTLERFAGIVGDNSCKGDGGPALAASFGSLAAGYASPATRLLRIDRALYIVDTDHGRIRVVDLDDGTIHTAFGADGCGEDPEVVVPFVAPSDIAVGPDGAVYVADAGDHCVLRILDGEIGVVAGVCGTSGFAGDEGPAVDALLAGVGGIDVDPDGALVIADTNNHRIRRLAPPIP